MIHDTLEQAEKELAKEVDAMALKFCPVINNKCRSACMCYRPGKVMPPTKAGGQAGSYPPYCEHPLVCGYMAVNVE